MSSKSGIYAITNTVNGHRYIGSAVNIAGRWGRHRLLLRRGTHCNPHLQGAWNKYGEDVFWFEIIEECAPGMLLDAEQRFLDTVHPAYNICPTAGSPLGVRRGPQSAEHRARIGMAQIGRKHSAETRNKMSAAQMGNTNSKGKKFTQEHRAKLSMAAQRRGPPSKETRAKMSASHVGRKLGPQTVEHRAKMSASRMGKKLAPRTAEHRAKLSAAGLADWAAKRADGYSFYSARCPKCDGLTMRMVRPGKVQCSQCVT